MSAGTFTWTIGDFRDDLSCIQSEEVDCAGHRWALKVYPGGTVSYAGYATGVQLYTGLYLVYKGSARSTMASFKLSIVNQKGRSDKEFDSSGSVEFNPGREHGTDEFIQLRHLKSNGNGHMKDGTVIIRVNISVIGKSKAKVNATLESINLSWNQLDDEAGKAIAAALKFNSGP